MEGLKSFAVELSCVDTTDMIFSWIGKDILGLQDNTVRQGNIGSPGAKPSDTTGKFSFFSKNGGGTR
jgi:hypothetical protein